MEIFIVLAALVAACSASIQYDICLSSTNNTVFPRADLRQTDLHFKPNMTQFTISLWTNPENDNPHYHFAYVINGSEFIAFRSNSNQSQFAIGNQIQVLGNATFTPPNMWTHVALTWENVNGTARVYINGVLTSTVTNWQKGKIFPANGSVAKLSLGVPYQAKGNPPALPLNTRTTKLDVWSAALPENEISNIFSCSQTDPGDIATWEGAVWHVFNGGSIEQTDLIGCSVCLVDYLEFVLDIVYEIFFMLIDQNESEITPVTAALTDEEVLIQQGVFDKRDILKSVIPSNLKRNVLQGILPTLKKRELIPKIVPSPVKRNNRQGIIPRLV